jgi:hypothetical protein
VQISKIVSLFQTLQNKFGISGTPFRLSSPPFTLTGFGAAGELGDLPGKFLSAKLKIRLIEAGINCSEEKP